MRRLLDTHIVIGITRGSLTAAHPAIASTLSESGHDIAASVASLWEIAIKTRLGKLDPGVPLDEIAASLEANGFTIVPIDRRHAVAVVSPDPDTRDPFDRLLLAQCAVEHRRLVTVDGALVEHPLAARIGRPSRKRPTGNPRSHP